MSLDDYINALIEREGGYTNHPSDKGGPTMYGITEHVARAFGYQGPMQDMPRATAVQIYKDRYWFQPKFSEVNEWSSKIAEELLDTGVNMGPAVAAKFLQRALNTLNRSGKLYPDITVDGGIGNMTIASLRSFLNARGGDGEKVLLRMLNAQQSVRYMEIAEKDQSQEEFEFGWQLHRVGV